MRYRGRQGGRGGAVSLPRRTRLLAAYGVCLVVFAAGLGIGRLDPAWLQALAPEKPRTHDRLGWAIADPAPPPRHRERRATTAGAIRVVDGDTLRIDGERVRLAGIDAPEMPGSARCAAEADGALRAKAALERMVGRGSVTLERTGTDRYGRTLAHVSVDGADAGDALIQAGLVRRWEGRRRSWC